MIDYLSRGNRNTGSVFFRRHLVITDDFPVSVLILNQSRKCLYPVSGIQVMNIIIICIGRVMDMPANYPVALTYSGELYQFVFKVGDIGNCGFTFA